MIVDYVRLSFRSVHNRKLRSWLTMIGIFLGIAALVSLMSLGSGLRSAITGQFALLGTQDLVVQAEGTGGGPPGTGVVRALDVDLVDELSTVTGVERSLGRIIENAKLEHNDELAFLFAGSLPDDQDEADLFYSTNNFEVSQGRQLSAGEESDVMIGAHIATDELTFSKGVQLRDKITIEGKEFRVSGILEERGSFIVDHQVIMSERAMRQLFDVDDVYDVILVRVAEGSDMEQVADRVREKMRRLRGVDEGDEDFTVETPASTLATVDSVLIGVQAFVGFIALVSLLVGGIGIMNTMYTAVLERKQEIGIMKSIGCTNKGVFTLFFIESGMLGLLGGGIGVLIGVALAEGFAFAGRLALGIDLIQAQFSWSLLIGALLFSFVVGTFAGTLPALSASRLNPVEALRK